MTQQSPHDTHEALGAWLETVQATGDVHGESLTIQPKTDPGLGLSAAFADFDSTSTAAPLSIKDTIAEGGMGLIRIAEQPALGREVVVKTLRDDCGDSLTEHLLREAWATGALEHPNIVPIHDIRVDVHGAPLIVLKRIEGLVWSDLMFDEDAVRTRFGADDLLAWNLEILRQVMQALRFAHSRGILHRDIKPDNVMIGSFGEVYVVDWGIALSLEHSEHSHLAEASKVECMAGTPCYMAPEMLGGKPLDERTDVYLIGAVLYEIISGHPPHRGSTLRALLAEIRESRPSAPPGCCPLLLSLCNQAMHLDPLERFQSVEDFSDALTQCSVQRGSQTMTEVATQYAGELEVLLAGAPVNRSECYRLFGALRFASMEALRIWPESQDATWNLDRALLQMVEFELTEGNPHAAQAMATQLTSSPPWVAEEIAKLERKNSADSKELGNFRKEADNDFGSQALLTVIGTLALAWTIGPLLQTQWAESAAFVSSYRGMFAIFLFFSVATSGTLYWARDSLSRTKFNRQIAAALAWVFPAMLILCLGCYWMGLDVVRVQQLMVLNWALFSMGVSTATGRRLFPIALLYSLTFLAVSKWPDARFSLMAASNLLLIPLIFYLRFARLRKEKENHVHLAASRRFPVEELSRAATKSD